MTWPLVPKWDPTNGVTTPTLWVDPSDSTTLLNTLGGAITNGATVGTCTSKDATGFVFQQLAAGIARPTWDSTGINGLGALRSNNQILSTTTNTGFTSLGGATFIAVNKYNSGVGGAAISFTMVDPASTQPIISMVQVQNRDHYLVGGRRVGTDAFASASGNAIPASNCYVVTGINDYANAQITLIESGVIGVRQQTFQTAGTTAGTEPTFISIAGGFAQKNGAVYAIGGPMDGWVGEILAWNSALTPDQLVGPHTYLRLKWGIN